MSTISTSNSPLNSSSPGTAHDKPSSDYDMWLHLDDTPEKNSMMGSIEGLADLPQFLFSTAWGVS